MKKLEEKIVTDNEIILIFSFPPTPIDEMAGAEIIFKNKKEQKCHK